MADPSAEPAAIALPRRRSRAWRVARITFLALAVVLVVVAGAVWLGRERIAGNIIGSELAKRHIRATYEIDQVGTRTQILRHVVIGDPARPDLTVERMLVRINPRFGIPTVGRVTLVRPRLYGSYRHGTVSFGEVDRLLFQPTGAKAFTLPDLDLAVEDGRALLETDFGRVGIKVAGGGNLRNGFRAEAAAIAPRLGGAGCATGRATLYGQIAIADRRPRFTGPLRVASVTCPGSMLSARQAQAQLNVSSDETLRKFDGTTQLVLGPATVASRSLARATASARFTWRDAGLTADLKLAGARIAAPELQLAEFEMQGGLRARRKFDRVEFDASLTGRGARLGNGVDRALANAQVGAGGTFVAPLLAQLRRQWEREGRHSTLAAEFSLRRTGQNLALSVPRAQMRGTSGSTLLSISRAQLVGGRGVRQSFAGSFATGGAGLPRIIGTITATGPAALRARLAMADYSAAGARLAIPEMVAVRRSDGTIGFAGQIRGSGPLPGGRADNLVLPISGSRNVRGAWSLWDRCTTVAFDGLRYAQLTLARQKLTLCPPRGAPILRFDTGGLQVAAGTPSVRAAGRLGQTPVTIRSGPIGFAYPGTLTAQQLDVALGPPATAQRFAINHLTANLGKQVGGSFAGADVHLFSVPLDILGASGRWRYRGGTLTLGDGALRVVDRQTPARFEPLMAQGADLTLANNRITAHAFLREPKAGREVVRVEMSHDLATGAGNAGLIVPGVTFGPGFQPTDLTQIAYGKVENVHGTVRGAGQVSWGRGGIASSGQFTSDSLDFAAAFGPVKQASGTIRFTDLLGLTTAPGQHVRVGSINPGIEVTDGDVQLSLRGGQVLVLEGGTWPFMGGSLSLRPVDITFGAAEERHYVLDVRGLDAARFVEHMKLGNLSATGIFDGSLPIVFDVRGNGRIIDGTLRSRAPGGNLSYLGDLTYKDLSPMANLAFGALRSLDYRAMRIVMNGDLTGEIITRVRFDGVSQGSGAARNLVTRALAGLPIRFDVNIRAQFYQLLGSLRATYDPSAIKDPRDLGLLDEKGRVIQRSTDGPPPPNSTVQAPKAPSIQPRESEIVR